MQTVQLQGLGYPVSICYGDLFLYIPAVLRLLGLPVRAAYGVLIISTNAFCAASTYVVARRALRSRMTALVLAALWTLSPYRLLDCMWLRAAVGEYLALSFFPVVAYGIFSAFFPDHPGASNRGWLWVGLGGAAIVYSHVISVLLAVLLFGPPTIALAISRRSPGSIGRLALGLGVALLLSVAYLVPFFDFYLNAGMRVVEGDVEAKRALAAEHAIAPAQLLFLLKDVMGGSAPTSANGEMPFAVGWATLATSLLWLPLSVMPGIRSSIPRAVFAAGLSLIVLGTAFAFACTTYFPWDGALGGALGSLVGMLATIQYPWRLVGPLAMCLVVAGGLALHALGRTPLSGFLRPLCAGIVCLCFLEVGYGLTTYMDTRPGMPSDYTQSGDSDVGAGGEYLPSDFSYEEVASEVSELPRSSGDVVVTAFSRCGTTLEMRIYGGSTGGTVTTPLVWYPHYRADSAEDACRVTKSEEGLVDITVPEGYSGDVVVCFAPPPSWTISLVTSIACIVVLGAHAARGARRSDRHHPRSLVP